MSFLCSHIFGHFFRPYLQIAYMIIIQGIASIKIPITVFTVSVSNIYHTICVAESLSGGLFSLIGSAHSFLSPQYNPNQSNLNIEFSQHGHPRTDFGNGVASRNHISDTYIVSLLLRI